MTSSTEQVTATAAVKSNAASLVREERAAQRASAAAEKAEPARKAPRSRKATRKAKAPKPAPKPKAAKPRSPESLAAKRATELRASGRSVGPLQVKRITAALGVAKTATAADVVAASGAKSMTHLKAMATGKDADVSPLRELGARIDDGYAKGRTLACVVLAVAVQRTGGAR